MARTSPLQPFHEAADAVVIPYGDGASVVAQHDVVELEYAAIRKSVGLMDCTHRGLLRLTGRDRLDFLHRMVTQDCRSMKPGEVRRAFVLTAKGRIVADLLVAHFEDHTLIDTDTHQAAAVALELDKLLFGEDVKIEDLSESHHRVSLHGPGAGDVLKWWRDGAGEGGWDFRHDETGGPGVHLWAPAASLVRFSEKASSLGEVFRLRFIGWMAWNIARIEAGNAVFHIDFGPDNLPHEGGPEVLAEAVSFTKGCYRGQEIVARMHSRGHPAKRLVGFCVRGDALPVAGVNVLAGESPESEVVGAVTSSTLSPMLSATPVGFAMVKWGVHEPGTKLYAPAEGRNVAVEVGEMVFYSGSPPTPS